MRSRVISGLWGAVAVRSYALARKAYTHTHTYTHTHIYYTYIHTLTLRARAGTGSVGDSVGEGALLTCNLSLLGLRRDERAVMSTLIKSVPWWSARGGDSLYAALPPLPVSLPVSWGRRPGARLPPLSLPARSAFVAACSLCARARRVAGKRVRAAAWHACV